jgi:hypothetical protein
MTGGKDLREGNGNGGMHLGSHFICFKLPVALSEAPGKIKHLAKLPCGVEVDKDFALHECWPML